MPCHRIVAANPIKLNIGALLYALIVAPVSVFAAEETTLGEPAQTETAVTFTSLSRFVDQTLSDATMLEHAQTVTASFDTYLADASDECAADIRGQYSVNLG
eukprot:SAG11_NODE_275_length_11309_cov_6.090901_7_plen_102_part_00